MQMTGIRSGDVVKCDVRGHVFFALVTEPTHVNPVTKKRVISVDPLMPNITFREVTSRQITDHWRKSRRKGSNGNSNTD